jgi:hypothetical protein
VRLLPLVLVPVLAIALAGCTDSAGPVVFKTATTCADSATLTDAVIGLPIQNAGPHPVSITSATFGSVSGVTVSDAWIVPNYTVGPNSIPVGISGYPLASPAWAKRQQITGATVPSNTFSNVAVRVKLASGATSGHASDLTIKYTDADHQSYVATSTAVVGFGPGGKCD